MKEAIDKQGARLDKHGDELVRLIEQGKHVESMIAQFHKEYSNVRMSLHKLRNDMQKIMNDIHHLNKSSSSEIVNHRINNRKEEINKLEEIIRTITENMHSLSIEAHAATENTVILTKIQERLTVLEQQFPLLKQNKDWTDSAVKALVSVGVMVLVGKSFLTGI